MSTQVGACPHCGAPIYSDTFFWSTLPPAPRFTCTCKCALPSYFIMQSTGTTAITQDHTAIRPIATIQTGGTR